VCKDTIARLCFGSSDRIPKWLLPVVRANLAAGGPFGCRRPPCQLGALRRGVDEHGEHIDVQDSARRHAGAAGRSQHQQPDPRLSKTPTCSAISHRSRVFVEPICGLGFASRDGARATLEGLLALAHEEATP